MWIRTYEFNFGLSTFDDLQIVFSVRFCVKFSTCQELLRACAIRFDAPDERVIGGSNAATP